MSITDILNTQFAFGSCCCQGNADNYARSIFVGLV